jgi:hypothetical protein
MAVGGSLPQLALVVSVEQAFVHCAKCVIRSHLWDRDFWPDLAGLPSHARCLIDQAELTETVEEIQASIEQSYQTRLY